jgi:hypothetical protein
MGKRKLLTGLIAISVICIVLTSGCVKENGSAPSPTATPTSTTASSVTPAPSAAPITKSSGLKTCAELNGYECGMGEECPGEWLDASDTFSCCSEPCTSSTGDEGVLTIEPFELNPENEELGEVI